MKDKEMREELAAIYGNRQRFSGVFVRRGKKKAYRGRGTAGEGFDHTVLFRDIRDAIGRIVADHLWFSLTAEFDKAAMVEGSVVSFDARVDSYAKGYDRSNYDYRLSRPTKVENHGVVPSGSATLPLR